MGRTNKRANARISHAALESGEGPQVVSRLHSIKGIMTYQLVTPYDGTTTVGGGAYKKPSPESVRLCRMQFLNGERQNFIIKINFFLKSLTRYFHIYFLMLYNLSCFSESISVL